MQDVFVRLWERPDTYDPDRGRLRSFLLTMAHSRAVERLRAEESQRRRLAAVQHEPVNTSAADPDHDLAVRTTGAAVHVALADLPPEQREPIEMAYFGGLSYREVAVALDEPEGTIRYRIRAGMQKMRAALQAEEVWPHERRVGRRRPAIARALGESDGAEPVGADEELVNEYREVLGELSPEITPRPGLEDEVMAAALARRPAAAPSVDRPRSSRANRVRIAALVAVGGRGRDRDRVDREQRKHRHAGTDRPRVTRHRAARRRRRVAAPCPEPASASFGRCCRRVAVSLLGTDGKGIVYDLRTDVPVSLGLISSAGTTVIGPAQAVNGTIGFVVDHPERVTAVDLIRNGATIGRAHAHVELR